GACERAQAGDRLASYELDEVDEVRSDVGEGARGAARVDADPPVRVARFEHPILQVLPRDGEYPTALTSGDACAGFAHHRVVSVDERHGADEAGLAGLSGEAAGVCGIRRKR